MPAPPYCSGTAMPSSPRAAICGKMFASKRCSLSRRGMHGATSRAAHSWTDCASSLCSSVTSKLIISLGPSKTNEGSYHASYAPAHVHGRAAFEVQLARRARAVGGDLEVIAAAKQRTDFAGGNVGIGRDDL